MESLSRSRVKRDIYPGFNTEIFIGRNINQQNSQGSSDIDQLSINSHDEENNQILSIYYEQIKQTYKAEDYYEVITLCNEALQRYEQAIKNQTNTANLNLDISKIRGILANTYILLFIIERKNHFLDQAKKCLVYQYEGIQTPYKKGQRLNNLGLCQMLNRKYTNAFKYYTQAFSLYNKSDELNLFGLLKNISEIYKQYGMYKQALKCYQLLLQQIQQKNNRQLTNQYTYLVISSLQCINQLKENTLYQIYYQRAKQLLLKIDKDKESQYSYWAKIRLEMIKYSTIYGIQSKSISKEQIERIFNEVYNMENNSSQIKLIKAQCCYFYRQFFRHKNWNQFQQLSKQAKLLFKQSQAG